MVDSSSTSGKKILIAVSSANPEFWPAGFHTGYFFTEVLHPYLTFKAHGYDVDIVSETGKAGIDQNSIVYAQIDSVSRSAYNDKNHEIWPKLTTNLKSASDVKAGDYAAIFYAGGHGASFDLPTATTLQKIGADIYESGGVIGTVCHGPGIFMGMKDKSGELIIKGKKVTAFNKRGEMMMMATGAMKKHDVDDMQTMMEKSGAVWMEPSDVNYNPMTPYTVTDGKIVSGVNPMSASPVAQKVCELIAGKELPNKEPKHSII